MLLPRPKADLVAQAVSNEILVYDPATRRAHRLNGAAAAVFSACQEGLSVDEAAERVDAPRQRDLVLAALAELSSASLVEAPADPPPRLGRREALRIWGKAALVPAVLTVMAPLPASAQSAACVVEGPVNCNAGTLCAPCTANPTPDADCATFFCGFARTNDSGLGSTGCAGDTPVFVSGCFQDNGGDQQQDCCAARTAAGDGNPYACCSGCLAVCP